MANLSELKGELLALRCYVAALLQLLPAHSRGALTVAAERNADLLRDQLDEAGASAFDRAAMALAARVRAG